MIYVYGLVGLLVCSYLVLKVESRFGNFLYTCISMVVLGIVLGFLISPLLGLFAVGFWLVYFGEQARTKPMDASSFERNHSRALTTAGMALSLIAAGVKVIRFF